NWLGIPSTISPFVNPNSPHESTSQSNINVDILTYSSSSSIPQITIIPEPLPSTNNDTFPQTPSSTFNTNQYNGFNHSNSQSTPPRRDVSIASPD
ncbi:hypothetical protein PanWU01x14_167290, partial [Parasponia andersonii]